MVRSSKERFEFEKKRDIQTIEKVIKIFENNRWVDWEKSDSASSFHFALCKNHMHWPEEMINLPSFLCPAIVATLKEELIKLKDKQ